MKIEDMYKLAKVLIVPLGLVLILFLLGFGSTARAETFTLATNEYPPFVSTSDSTANLSVEIVQAAIEAAGHTVQIEIKPWARCEEDVRSGVCVGTFPYVRTKERELSFRFSRPITRTRYVFFYIKNDTPDFQYSDNSDLVNRRLGLVRGYSWNKSFKATDAIVSFHNSLSKAMQLLESGRLNLVPEAEAVGWYTIRKNFPKSMSDFVTSEKPISVLDDMVMVSKTNPRSKFFLSEFNRGLEIIEQNGVLQSILRKYHIR